MKINNSIRKKLFIFFVIMGAIPFVVLIIVGAANIRVDLEDAAVETSLLRNTIISEHVTELVEKNMAVQMLA